MDIGTQLALQQLQEIIFPILYPNSEISLRIPILSIESKILRKHKLPLDNKINSAAAEQIYRI